MPVPVEVGVDVADVVIALRTDDQPDAGGLVLRRQDNGVSTLLGLGIDMLSHCPGIDDECAST